jgi:hypothetical protein
MAQFPVWFAWKSPIGKGASVVTDQSGLIEAEFNAAPAQWKLFPFTSATKAAQQKAAEVWAGVTAPGTSNSVNPKVAAQQVSTVLGLPTFTNTRNFVVRTVKVLVGMALIVIGINALLKSEGIDVPKLPPVVPV